MPPSNQTVMFIIRMALSMIVFGSIPDRFWLALAFAFIWGARFYVDGEWI